MKKRLIIYSLCALFLLFYPFYKRNIEIDLETLSSKFSEFETIKQANSTELKRFYHLNETSEYLLMIPSTSLGADEIAIFKFNTPEEKKMIEEAIYYRKNSQLLIFDGYGEKQCEDLNNSIFLQKGDYLIYIVKEDSKQILKLIEEARL